MFRRFMVAFSIVGLLGLGGLVGVQDQPARPGITCIDCWEMKIR